MEIGLWIGDRELVVPTQSDVAALLVKVATPRTILDVFVVAYAVTFTFLSMTMYRGMNVLAYDYGIMESSIWNTLHGKGFFVNTIEGGSHFLVHLSPIMIGLLPIYGLYQDPVTLYVIRAIAVGLGAIVVFKLAERRVSERHALAFATIYLLYPPLWATLLNSWDPVTLAIPALLATFYFYETDRYGLFLASALVALSCKQTVAVPLVLLGVYVVASYPGGPPRLAEFRADRGLQTIVLVAVLAVGWFGVYLVMPSPPTGWSAFHAYYGYLGDSLPEMIVTVVTQPWLVLERLFEYETFRYLVLLYLPLAFLPFLAVRTQVMTLPTIAVLVLAGLSGVYRQYPAKVIPFIVVGFVLAVSQFDPDVRRKLFALCLLTLVVSAGFTIQTPGETEWNQASQVVGPGPHEAAAAAVIDEIPDDADLVTTSSYYTYTYQRTGDTYLIEDHPATFTDYPDDIEYVLLDQSQPYSYPHDFDVEEFLADNDMKLVSYVDGIGLYERGYDGEVSSPAVDGVGSLEVEYFADANFEESLFTAAALSVSADWGDSASLPGMPTDDFGVRWTGYVYAPETGEYEVLIRADDHGEVWIDGESVTGEMDDDGVVDDTGSVTLQEGWHEIRLDYAEDGGQASIDLEWRPPGQSEYEAIPNAYLAPPDEEPETVPVVQEPFSLLPQATSYGGSSGSLQDRVVDQIAVVQP